MSYNVKFIKENIYTDPNNPPQKKKIPLSIASRRISVRVRGWKVDTTVYNMIPKSSFFTALLRALPKQNLKNLNHEQLIQLFNKNVIPPFLPITDFQEMTFYKDGRVWFKKIKTDK